METLYESEKEAENSNLKITGLNTTPVVSIVLPAYNEAETIKEVVIDYFEEIVNKIPSKLIVAEDGSNDNTPEILASLANEIPISLFSDRSRKGYAKGVGDALKKCTAKWIFFSDSDGQYFPNDFWKLWRNRQGYDIIIGRKIRRSEGIHRTILSRGFHVLFNQLFGLDLHDADCGFRLIRRDVIQSVVDETRFLKFSFWAEFTIRACLKGFRVCEVPIDHTCRANGGTRIYAPSKLPLIILKQLNGLIHLYLDAKKNV
jgi:glycosyltransferase involved in cell wall biosynthesis